MKKVSRILTNSLMIVVSVAIMFSISYAQEKPKEPIIQPVQPEMKPGPLPGLPDLTIWTELRGRPTLVGDKIEIPFRVTVQNTGRADAGIFKVSTEYEIVSGGRPGLLTAGAIPFTVPGQANMWYPFTIAPLPPGTPPRSQVTFNGKVSFDKAFEGVKVRIRAIADSTAGDEFMPAHGRVRESNEGNNTTAWSVVDLPGLPDIVFGEGGANYALAPQYADTFIAVIYVVAAKNIGWAEAGIFETAVDFEVVSGARPELPRRGLIRPEHERMPKIVVGKATNAPLPPSSSIGLGPTLHFPPEFEGVTIRFRAIFDINNRVNESNETNNTSPWSREVTFIRR
jgi:hypothetical protein